MIKWLSLRAKRPGYAEAKPLQLRPGESNPECFKNWIASSLVLLAMTLNPGDLFAAQVKEVISEKGIKAWLVEEHSLPLLAVKISFKDSGYAYDAVGKEGRANMTAALLMEGAGDLDSASFNEMLENYALRMNTGASDDSFEVSVEAISEHKEKAFAAVGMAITSPRFDKSAIERVKSRTLSLVKQQEQQPGYQLRRAWLEAAYGQHPYANLQLGSEKTIAGLSAADFREVMSRYIAKENMVVSVVGDITPEELKNLLDKNLAGIAEKYASNSEVSEVKLPENGKTIKVDFDIPQTMISFGAQGLKRNDPNYMAAHIANHIIGGVGMNSRLYHEIREKRGLTYSVSSYLNPKAHSAAWQGAFATKSEQAEGAKDALVAALHDFAEKGVNDVELEDAKEYLVGSFVLSLDSNAKIADFITNMQINNLGIDYLEKRNDLVRAVREEEVSQKAKFLADPEKLLIIMLGKK